jgi:hypothetical protein
METKETFAAIEQYVDAHDSRRTIQTLKSPVYDADDEVIGIQGMFWDITDRIDPTGGESE